MKGRIKRKSEVEITRSNFPRIGKIKVGNKAANGAPQSVDYFICDSKYASYFKEAYGEKPDTIQIVFVSDNISESCNERYECRDGQGRLIGYGDGEVTSLYNAAKDAYEPSTDRDAIKAAGKWETILTIQFVIPKIKGVFGVFTYTTKGDKSSIPQIRDAFDTVQQTAGTVVNVPFDLTVQKVKSQKPGSKFQFPVVSLVPNIAADNMQILHNYLSQGNSIKELGPGPLTDDKVQHLIQSNNDKQ